ncbi:MAG: DNA polymerase IV [bacterium]|nr:DNA polymerase IV [bacterium]
MPPSPTILHLDMDAFFAQVEQLRDPSLKGKPLCVGGIPGQDRGAVASASYEARKYGIHAGMALLIAQRLCPQAIFMRAHGDVYLEISRRIVNILRDFSDQVDPSSIDESYVDITGVLNYFGGAETIGRQIKERICKEVNLTCSVGVAPTRTLAKLAANLQKPDGLTIVSPEDVPKVIFPLPVEKIPGVGAKMQKKLNELGIFTIQQLVDAPNELLFKRFGENGVQLQKVAKGDVDWEIDHDHDESDAKSMGNSRTFSQDTSDPELLRSYVLSLVQMVGRRLRAADLVGRTLTLTIRYKDFSTFTHRQTFGFHTNDENDIFGAAWKLFEERYNKGIPVRLLGVSISHLVRREAQQMDLFNRETKLYSAVDNLKEKFGEAIIQRSSTMNIRTRRHISNVNFAKPNRKDRMRRSG